MKKVCLLRGINVGGHKKILMAELKSLFLDLGFTDVVTYIQSGNVVFGASGQAAPELIRVIEDGIAETFGFEVPVVIRSHPQLVRVVAGSPFGSIDLATHGTLYSVAFLDSVPPTERAELLEPLVTKEEEFFLCDDHLYLHYPHGSARSKLTIKAIERRLEVVATVRNWKSLIKLRDLSAPAD